MPASSNYSYTGSSTNRPYDDRAYNAALSATSAERQTFGDREFGTIRNRQNQLGERSAHRAASNLAMRFGGNLDAAGFGQGLGQILTGQNSQTAADFASAKLDMTRYNNDVNEQRAAGLRDLAGIELRRNDFTANNDWRNNQLQLERERWEYERRRQEQEDMLRQQVMHDWGSSMLYSRKMDPTTRIGQWAPLNPISMAYPQMMLNQGGGNLPSGSGRRPGDPGALSADSAMMADWGPNRYYGYEPPPPQNNGNGNGNNGNGNNGNGGGGNGNGGGKPSGKTGYMDKYGMGYTR